MRHAVQYGCCLYARFWWFGGGVTPGPIPNPAVKPSRADDTRKGKVGSRQNRAYNIRMQKPAVTRRVFAILGDMFSWRRRRQSFILFLVFCVLGFITTGLFVWLKPVPSCDDAKLNQGELGVDCGGPCARVCQSETVPLLVEWTRTFPVGGGYYDVVAKISNRNNTIGVPELSYTVELFDEKNVSISKRRGTTFVNPNESLYIFEEHFFVGERIPRRAVLLPEGTLAWQRSSSVAPKLTVLNKVFSNDSQPLLTASLLNESVVDLRDVSVVGVLFDNAGNAYGASATILERLGKGEQVPIFFTWREPFTEGPTNNDISPRINTFLTPRLLEAR